MPRTFQFIDATDRSSIAKRQNDKIARSHAANASRSRQKRGRPSKLKEESSVIRQTGHVRPSDHKLARPLSPVFGGLRIETFSPGHQQWPVEALDYFCNRVMTNAMSKHELSWYYDMYCTRPLVFHAMQFSAANHQDRMHGYIEKTRSAEVIFHKGEAIRLLNIHISDLKLVEYGVILMAITSLMRNEPDLDQLQPDPMLLFRPRLPDIYNLNVYGRGKGGQTHGVHHQAVYRMIDAAGGLQGLGGLGVAKATAAHDLMLTSRIFERPCLPNIWTNSNLVRSVMEAYGSLESHGFSNRVPGGLPVGMLSTFSYLIALDHVLERSRDCTLSDDMRDTVRSAISDVQHRVMSLPPWSELELAANDTVSSTLYECCRWSMMLYSMAVIFPIPVAIGWHVRLLEHLHVVLEAVRFEAENTRALLMWSLFIANIAAVGTSEQHYFKQKLTDLLSVMGRPMWTTVHNDLRHFVWSDGACSEGGLAVYNLLWSGITIPETQS